MASQKCMDNVAAASPPFNTHCDPRLCAQLQATIDTHCSENGMRPDDPWLMPLPDGNWCNCCCSCYGYDTPIEARPGVFVKVQEIATGDTILAAGVGLEWLPTRVTFAAGMAATPPSFPVLNVVFRFAPKDVRLLQVTDDTLFLLTSNVLKTAGVLVPGDRLRRADGGEAEVIGPVTKAFVTGVHSVELGPFDGRNLDRHLLNSFGVVTADFSVQRIVSTGQTHDVTLVHESVRDAQQLVAGTEEYLNEYAPSQTFLAEAEAAGIRIHPAALHPPRPMIAVPRDAKRFLDDDQAEDIRRNAPRFLSTNTFRITVTEKLIEMARAGCDDMVMLIDWDNASPNAYAWTQLRQRFVVLTGGLLRVKAVTEAAIALILVQMRAYHADITCAGEAAAEAMNSGLRHLWPQALFPLMCERGLKEIATLFEFVEREHAQGDPRNRCDRPSLDCLQKVYAAALSLQPLPDCARPGADDAYSRRQSR
jgi:hypothetical protein